MSFGGTDRSLCNKLLGDFDGLLAPGRSAQGDVNGYTNDLKGLLGGLAGNMSPSSEIDDALYDFQNQVNNNLPGSTINDLQNFKNFLDNCVYLGALQPVSAMLATLFGIYNKISNLISVYNVDYPEFGAGNIASALDDLIGLPSTGDSISGLLGGADGLLNCLDLLCTTFDSGYNGDLTTMTSDLQGVYTDLNLVDDPSDPRYGMTDFESIYQSQGLSPTEVLQMEKVRTNINGAKQNSIEAVGSAVAAIQEETKNGTIFA